MFKRPEAAKVYLLPLKNRDANSPSAGINGLKNCQLALSCLPFPLIKVYMSEDMINSLILVLCIQSRSGLIAVM